MNQQKVNYNEQAHQKVLLQGSKPKVKERKFNNPLIYTQSIIGNHGILRRLEDQSIQTKLTISSSEDKYEKEADRVAEQVMRMPDPEVLKQPEEEEEQQIHAKPFTGKIIPIIQRQIDEEFDEELVQAKKEFTHTPKVKSEEKAHINAFLGGGQAFPESTRTFFEPRFGYDFSRVRVHTDANANKLSVKLGARAFTTGRDVFFRQGAYDPGSGSCKKLIGHELTHVVQQSDASTSHLKVAQASDSAERQWERVTRTITRRKDMARTSPSVRTIARQVGGGPAGAAVKQTAQERRLAWFADFISMTLMETDASLATTYYFNALKLQSLLMPGRKLKPPTKSPQEIKRELEFAKKRLKSHLEAMVRMLKKLKSSKLRKYIKKTMHYLLVNLTSKRLLMRLPQYSPQKHDQIVRAFFAELRGTMQTQRQYVRRWLTK